jgi:hypothetical protein
MNLLTRLGESVLIWSCGMVYETVKLEIQGCHASNRINAQLLDSRRGRLDREH